MSMRISVVEKPILNKAHPINNSYSYAECERPPRSEFYIRSNYISRKPKSPFRKYESCVSGSFKATTYPTREGLATASSVQEANNRILTKQATNSIQNEDGIVIIEIVNNKSKSLCCNYCKARMEPKSVHFEKTIEEKLTSKLDGIKLSPETAEKFVDILVAEDVMLRNKIADGQVNEEVLKRLERLTEMRQKYMKYKEKREQQKKISGVLNSNQMKSHRSLSAMRKSVVSLSDPAFIQELKRHPLVKC